MAESKGKVGSLFYGMSLKTKDFKKNLKQARKNVGKIGREIVADFKKIGKAGALIGAGMGAGTAALMLFTKASLDAIKAQVILAESIGSTQGEIAGLELFTQTMGVETQMVIDKMREFGGLDQFKTMAEQVKNAGDEQAQLNKSIELFGNEGTKMLPILQQGAEGFAKMEKKALDLGLALSPEQVEKSRVVWEQLSDTWDHIRGVATQIGQSLMKPLGLALAAIKSFTKAFKSEILGGFESLGATVESFMKGTINLFVKFGIPFINGFINGAMQIGQAFATLFNWLTPAGDSAFGSLSGFFTKVVDFLATIKSSLTFGIAKTLEGLTNGIFKAITFFHKFIGQQVQTLAFMLESAGLEGEGFGQAVADEFGDQRAALTKMQRSFTKPLVQVQKTAFKEMVSTLTDQMSKNKKFTKIFMKGIDEFSMKLEKAEEKTAVKTADIVAKAAIGVSKQMIGMISSGSQEEQNILNKKQDKNLVIQTKQLKEMKELKRAVLHLGEF